MTSPSQFYNVPETDEFLSLFPHRWNYLWAEHAKPGESPQWQRETRFPLSDRHIIQGQYLYGVEFGMETNYFMLDIDRGSVFHPKHRDRFGVGRILDALEPLGVTDFIPVTSSYSEGIHLYFPLSQSFPSWQIAEVVSQLLKFKGIVIEDGQLEVFPNVRLYDSELGKHSLFKAHRLPLQLGSYLLTENWELRYSSPEIFCKEWRFCAFRNEINLGCFNSTLRLINRNYTKLGFKGEKFLNDLNTEIDQGWTDFGQTNRLLGRITLRAYVFGHRLNGGQPLTGERLINEIIKTATRLPGYGEFCRHRQEIYQRAKDWAKCAESSRYYPYGFSPYKKVRPPEPETPQIAWNTWRKRHTTERLCFAIADLWNKGRFPAGITDRFQIFTQEYGFSGETLYQPQYLELWHPDFIGRATPEPVENPPHPPNIRKRTWRDFCSREQIPQVR
ncbi:MAG: hypothetical protein HC881_22320 [Leptolyngbyaceae cyanobacterium SL_7_1]|nr:hypothetical protein [Leptolyngbyaceae cyanobacterium SL_7_1]